MVDALSLLFGHLQPHEPLWPRSDGVFRKRFRALGKWFGFLMDANQRGGFGRPTQVLDLGSLRSGGATHFFLLTEDGRRLQLRGRWVNEKVMTIYLQELVSTTFLSRQPEWVQKKVTLMQDQADLVWGQTLSWVRAGASAEQIPRLWKHFLTSHSGWHPTSS